MVANLCNADTDAVHLYDYSGKPLDGVTVD